MQRRPIRYRVVVARLVGLASAAALVVSACGGSDTGPSPDDARPAVIATTTIWADVVTNVSCGLVSVRPLTPRGTDPHAFEPSLADRADMDRAALIVANGLGLEETLRDTIDAVEAGGVPVVRLAESMRTSEGDPHVWFDPTLVAGVTDTLAEALIQAASLDAASVGECATAYRDRLLGLDAELQALVAALPAERRILVTNHDSLGYLADRYGFEVLGTVIPGRSSLAETNPSDLADLADLIQESEVAAIFVENESSADDAEALADRIGVSVIRLDTGNLGGEGSSTGSYEDFMRQTVETIVSALAAPD